MGDQLRLHFTSSIQSICDVNSSFASCRIQIMYTGQNRNGSFISHQAVEDALPTIYNCPIVCNYDVESDSIGGHDVDFATDEHGNVKMVNLTNAIGVVPSGAAHYFQNVVEEDGSTHEYLYVDALLWKRTPVYEKLVRDGIESQSMEINVDGGHYENGMYMISKFTFTAFCLLGDGINPCFESASVQLFNQSDIKNQFALMMEDLKENFVLFEKDFVPNNVHLSRQCDSDDNNIETNFAKGGDEKLGEDNVIQVEENQFSLTGEQLREELIAALCACDDESCWIKTDWGDMCLYIYHDYDPESMEVYAYDVSDWKLYGFTYSMDGDNVVVDFESKKRKKIMVVDFDEGSTEYSLKSVFSVVADAAMNHSKKLCETDFSAERDELSQKYQDASNQISQMTAEIEELRTYKADRMSADRRDEEEVLFNGFADLNGNSDFEALRCNCSDMTISEIEEKCFAIRGRCMSKQAFSVQKESNKIPVERSKKTDGDEYGGIFAEFPPYK